MPEVEEGCCLPILPGKDDGKYYLVPGDYKLTFTDANGHSVEGKFEVKDPSAKKNPVFRIPNPSDLLENELE